MWYDEKERWDKVFESVRASQQAEMQRRLHEAAERRRDKAAREARRAEPENDEGHGLWDRMKHLLH
jgi:hypothetical protein